MAGHLNTLRKEHTECGSSSSNKLLVVEDADRLSTLPLEIQSQILSFLPSTDAAKIGLLSRMWRTTWYSLSKLAFDYCKFPEMKTKLDAFVNFIDQTLAHHDESDVKILELQLWSLIDFGIPIKTEWIAFAVQHNVEKLVLYGKIDEVKKLSDCVFSCQSLVKLELAVQELVLTLPETFALPNLRKLKFKFLVLSELVLSQDLFSRLPALEKLSIFFCNLGYFKDISISSLKLKEFIMCSCPGMESCSVSLQTPRLSKFIYINNDSKESELEIQSNVFQLVINGGGAYVKNESMYDFSRSVIKVTKELFKKNNLSLSHWLIEYLSMVHYLPRQVAFDLFHNLVTLDINLWPVMEHVRILMLLISRCPNLATLFLVIVTSHREDLHLPKADYSLDYDIEGGFCSLIFIAIENFGGEETELMLVKSLLANTTDLVLMRIVMSIFMSNNDMDLKMSEIHGYEKASRFADVIFD